jgi:hypothetical protein
MFKMVQLIRDKSRSSSAGQSGFHKKLVEVDTSYSMVAGNAPIAVMRKWHGYIRACAKGYPNPPSETPAVSDLGGIYMAKQLALLRPLGKGDSLTILAQDKR